jgi:sialate O-acetylesterase
MKKNIMVVAVFSIFILSLLATVAAKANIILPAVIGNNMVLEQRSSVKLWGWGNPTEKVLVTNSWDGKTDSTVVTANAKWEVMINTPVAGGPYTITIKGYNTIVLENVLIGEVWICSGQSNMEYSYYWGLPQMNADLPAIANSNIRFFKIPRTTAEYPQDDCKAQWEQCDSNTVKSFSAVGYYFGKKINSELNVPIGLIDASWGGTPAETWTPAELVNNDPVLKQAALKQTFSSGWPISPGYTYNGMIAPLTNYSIAGTIWYQGESNTGTAATYYQLFSTMINAWREEWNRQFPFYYVQIAPYRYGNKNIAALLREAQLKTLSQANVGMVVITDLADDTTNIHPKDKRDVGFRLANLALVDTYGYTLPGVKSPEYKSMEIENGKVVISFNNADSDLAIKGEAVTGLFIAGSDKQFYPALAEFKQSKMIVWSDKVQKPVAVRYAFSNTAVGNIFNKKGLPLGPFRTDEWEVDTSKE